MKENIKTLERRLENQERYLGKDINIFAKSEIEDFKVRIEETKKAIEVLRSYENNETKKD